MFQSATNFNQNIGNWDVSNVTNMSEMFNQSLSFNNGGSPSINNWNTGNVTNMPGMFRGCTNFNQPIGGWNINKVTSFVNTFFGCVNFNQDLGSWSFNTSQNINMQSMFFGATSFNNGGSPSINNWNVSNVTNMQQMFLNTLFNQPIGNWNISLVTNTLGMFNGASQFNQDISNWNVSNVTTMGGINNGMFISATSFNQNLSSWNLRSAGVILREIFRSSGMSCQNYTDTIVGWANYVVINSNTPINVDMNSQTSRIFDGTRSGGAGFATAADARTYLTTATPTGAGWTISGDTLGGC
jgi:surface protein